MVREEAVAEVFVAVIVEPVAAFGAARVISVGVMFIAAIAGSEVIVILEGTILRDATSGVSF